MNNFKIVLLGDHNTGKTTVLNRLLNNTFQDQHPTIGVEYKSLDLNIDGHSFSFSIWDTAGQRRFRSVSKAYFRNSFGCLAFFDLTSRNSFNELNQWIQEFQNVSKPNCPIIIVGNKSDISDQRVITETEGQLYANMHHFSYIETSAYTGANVLTTFNRLGCLILHDNGIISESRMRELTGLHDYEQNNVNEQNNTNEQNNRNNTNEQNISNNKNESNNNDKNQVTNENVDNDDVVIDSLIKKSGFAFPSSYMKRLIAPD